MRSGALASGAAERLMNSKPSSLNLIAEAPIRNSITARKPSSRRRIRSTVQPTISPSRDAGIQDVNPSTV